jgi:tagatose 1,6-diphosphate aldolase
MRKITIGKLRGLQQLANARGLFTIMALDHRDSLRRALNKENPEAVSYRDVVDFKLELCRTAAPSASAVLLDPVYGAAQAIAAGVIPGHAGLLVSLEKTGYGGGKDSRTTEILPGWSVTKIKRMGASAVKLLVYFRPDLQETTARQLKLIADVAGQCQAEDIPLLVETVSYPLGESGDGNRYAAELPQLVIETARQVTALPVDVLKVEFPADIRYEKDKQKLAEYCRQLNRASQLPWVLLSAGADYATFKEELEIACAAGASGFLAGRALWQEGAAIRDRVERLRFFQSVALPRLEELTEIANSSGQPWHTRSTDSSFETVSEGWYQRYSATG